MCDVVCEPVRILVTGSTGLIGSALVSHLENEGHSVTRLIRSEPRDGNGVQWDPDAGSIDAVRLNGLDGVVHLGGENLASGLWTTAKKEAIRRSRVVSTELLARTVAGLTEPPKVFACASAVGFYGDRGDAIMSEDCVPGDGFLASVCQDWETATAPASDAGIRVANMRFGLVLSPAGGALEKMLLAFRMGFGGHVGSGRQYVSWVSIGDVVRAIHYVLSTDSLAGPVNVMSPNSVTNHEFAKALGHVLHRPSICHVPKFVVRGIMGQAADELLLSSCRAVPKRLQEAGFQFDHPDIEGALKYLLEASHES